MYDGREKGKGKREGKKGKEKGKGKRKGKKEKEKGKGKSTRGSLREVHGFTINGTMHFYDSPKSV